MVTKTSAERDGTGRSASVACPNCGERVGVRVPEGEPDLVVRRYVAAWGDHETVTCPAGHRFWVYFC